jgi:hypothetical protein
MTIARGDAPSSLAPRCHSRAVDAEKVNDWRSESQCIELTKRIAGVPWSLHIRTLASTPNRSNLLIKTATAFGIVIARRQLQRRWASSPS